jgi:hypothetical protein
LSPLYVCTPLGITFLPGAITDSSKLADFLQKSLRCQKWQMKMLSEQGSQLVLPTQGAYDLRDGQFGKESMGLQAYRQHRGEHLDQQSRVQAMTLSLHGTNMEDRFEYLPETFNQMMLLPNVPDFRTSHRDVTKVHQIITTGCTFLEKEKNK